MKAESVSPEELQLWLAGYVLGDLSPEEADRLEALLKLRPELHRELQALQQALETAYGVEEKQPPPALRASLLQHMRSRQPNRCAPPPGLPRDPVSGSGAWGRWPQA
jgi:anti-sigma factor RsiW